ncbi:hypothetical protein JW879_03425 [candidate division WOR-3 bacterium]|nr:hypothetical protein [candidate division WOR-3 bacterium]
MISLICLLLISQGPAETSNSRWDPSDILIEDSLGPYVAFAADYNYTTGDIYVACLVDSGYYFGDHPGWAIFRSQDHGLNWERIFSSAFPQTDWDARDIDLVVARDDTLYVSAHAYRKSSGHDRIEYCKFYEGPSNWVYSFLNDIQLSDAEIRSPKLVRDDFEPFYLYSTFIQHYDGGNDLLYLNISIDKLLSWGAVEFIGSVDYHDCDLTVSDSTVYWTYSFFQEGAKRIRTRVYRDRCFGLDTNAMLQTVSDTINANVRYPRIGATTTLPDNGQLVYTFFSQKDSETGNWDLLYKYSEDGGINWTSTPDTLRKGSKSAVRSDIRGYEAEPNEYIDITYSVTTSVPFMGYNNYFRWSSESDPTDWHDNINVDGGLFGSVPELVYSPGAPGSGAGVVYNDYNGNLWFDAPWLPSGIDEEKDKVAGKINSQIVLAGSSVEIGSADAIVYDVTGREIITLNSKFWDLKDGKGEEVKAGIYFIIDEENGYKLKLSILK